MGRSLADMHGTTGPHTHNIDAKIEVYPSQIMYIKELIPFKTALRLRASGFRSDSLLHACVRTTLATATNTYPNFAFPRIKIRREVVLLRWCPSKKSWPTQAEYRCRQRRLVHSRLWCGLVLFSVALPGTYTRSFLIAPAASFANCTRVRTMPVPVHRVIWPVMRLLPSSVYEG